MRRLFLVFTLLIIAFGTAPPANAQWGTPTEVEIHSPSSGEALQGVIPIIGITSVEGLGSWEISFSYISNSRDTWFLIDEGDQAFENEIITQWDTTTITDGDYLLRLRVYLAEDQISDALITDLRVRNYTIIETSLPGVTLKPDLTPTIEPTATSQPLTPTLLPGNPIEVTELDIINSLSYGAVTAFALIALIGLYASIRKKIQ